MRSHSVTKTSEIPRFFLFLYTGAAMIVAIALGKIVVPTESAIAFQENCAERGDSRRHAKVINPLHQHKIFCNQPAHNREALINPQSSNANAIHLCNWNVYGLPIKRSGRRQKNIANYIAYGCDIFVGQEHWSVFDRRGFRQRSKSHAPDWTFKYFGHPLPVHPGSGLMIGSVWPIEKTAFSPWPGGLFKNAGYKGIAYAQIKTPEGLIDVFNLHLAAGKKFVLKEQQVQHMTNFIQSTHQSGLPLIITGDFNFNRRWRFPSSQINAIEWLGQQLGVRAAGFNTRIEHTLLNEKMDYLDHRLLADWASSKEGYMSPSFIRELSDHPGVITRVKLKPQMQPQDAE